MRSDDKTVSTERDQVRRRVRLRWEMLHVLYRHWTRLEPYQAQSIPAAAVGSEIGVTDKTELQSTFMYLKGAGLVDFTASGPKLAITTAGIDEVEQALSEPDQRTEHFQPVNVINVWGGMHSSQIQQASPRGTQVIEQASAVDWTELRRILTDLRQEAAHLPEAERSVVEADIDTVLAQAGSTEPRLSMVRECLGSLRRMSEGALGGVAAGRLLSWMQQFNW